MKHKHSMRYATRDALLRSLGFRSYKAYLQSDEWRDIRARVFQEYSECICCDSKVEVVHHFRYDSATLLGIHLLHLAPLCHQCHQKIEILGDGEKASMAQANTLMLDMARKKNAKQLWLQRFHHERKQWKSKRLVDVEARRDAWQRKVHEQHNKPRDYSGVFWIRARRR
jgi:hypothetical protein